MSTARRPIASAPARSAVSSPRTSALCYPPAALPARLFTRDALTRVPRLLLALNRGTYSEAVSYDTSVEDGSPRLLSATPRSQITVARSASNNESEGLAATGAPSALNPLGGVLHWQMLPLITPPDLQPHLELPTAAPAAARRRERAARPATADRALSRPKADGGLQPPLHRHCHRDDRRQAGPEPRTGLPKGEYQSLPGGDRLTGGGRR